MSRFDDYPYAVIRDALGTVIGRLFLVAVAILLGAWLAGLSATGSIVRSLVGIGALHYFLPTSIVAGVGFFVMPLILIFAIVYVRSEWPLWTCVVCVVLMWWNMHGIIRWTLYDSPTARMQQKLNEMMHQTTKEMTDSGWKTKDGVSFSKTIGPAHPGPTRSGNH